MPSPPSGNPSIRILIPAHRDRDALSSLLPDLLDHWHPDELQIADTGADDAANIAAAHGVPCLVVERQAMGRARQMNAAARLHPEADLFLFLHADTRLPPTARESLIQAWQDGAVGGAFSRRFDSPSRFLRLTCSLANWRVRHFGLAFGDQALFARRDVFERLGGFPDQPVFEDWDFTRRLQKEGPMRLLTPGVVSSARRFEVDGPIFRTLKDLRLTLSASTWRGRRRLYGKWMRLTRPEYCSTKLLYLPVVCALASRALRKGKHPMDFSACNPCIPGSEMIGESKMEILDKILERKAVAEYQRLPGDMPLAQRCERVAEFMRETSLDFPVVIKPDVGERGRSVVIAKSPADVEAALRDADVDFMVQAFAPGEEFGVFYIRHPDETRGRICAVTLKTFSTVTGDGRHTLEDLILLDPRAVCQAQIHFQHLRARLREIPPAGEHVPLTDIGNHCRGTLFEDGAELITPALEHRIDDISKSLAGFHVGRYDLMAPDLESFQRGEGLKVIELNGVSSEATSMYDPRNDYHSEAFCRCFVNQPRRLWICPCREFAKSMSPEE